MRAIILFLALQNVAPDPSHGERTYKTFCVGCHGVNGEGTKLGISLIEDKSRLMKSDEELINSIRNGQDGMPAFSWLLTEEQAAEVIKYLKETFSENETPT
jgi:cytochrome c6